MPATENTDAATTSAPSTTESIEVVLPRITDPDGLELRDQTPPTPGAGQVLVRMEATGISFAEQQMMRGRYYDQPAFPFVPGYDLVGRVEAVGAGVDPSTLGRRVAAVTKTGGWASRVVVDAADLLPVPDDIDAATVEALLVNGITAYKMLHAMARPRAGRTVVVLGANGGVGDLLVQLARHDGLRVLGTASPQHHEALRARSVEPVDYRAPDAYDQLRLLAPEGVDAVFDHIGGPGLRESWRLLRRGGRLVSYGSVATVNDRGNPRIPVLKLILRLALWSALPDGRSGGFFDFWAGRRDRSRFNAGQREAVDALLELVRLGAIRPQIAERYPLSQVREAMHAVESRSHAGKIVLLGGAHDAAGG
ncbi:NADPH2:quinone reductase [Diaminobutyricimonas aerilata]|uniref:NADPH2:quinone reductase n=1 Tax=Diaminobutyricimonas aerilata TaxID=1162967 RepID=A0A2M9CM62_9MICO|nr:medium chain dehydrogenase/reductase family protein [Diaminobutyricimonas aerilata]PJJ72974.1 NADPH2:quinone reductase [Diaminobutyricimonas aerilata]